MESMSHESHQPGEEASEHFTGTVHVSSVFDFKEPARATGLAVTFEPGARTAWHTHPLGQVLIVTGGHGLAQRWGGPVEQLRPGDVVSSAPGEKHWHGATPATSMTHLAIQERLNGRIVDWLEKVGDEEYARHVREAEPETLPH